MRSGQAQVSGRFVAVGLAAASGLCAWLAVLQWSGYIQSDDMNYVIAARGGLAAFPYLPQTHWGLRHLVVWPIAVLFALFGENETTLCAGTALSTAALLALTAWGGWRLGGARVAVFAAGLAAGAPLLAASAGFVATDAPEAACVVASLLLWLAGLRGGGRGIFVASGVCAAFALLTRETSAALLVFYAAAWALGGRQRAQLWLLAGLVPVMALDWAVLFALSGDPVFRLHVAMRGVRNDSPLTRGAMRASMEGVVAGLPWLLRPLALPFIGAAFGLFAWLAVPLAGAGAVRLGGERARLIRLLLGFCAAWVGVNFYLLSDFLWLLPRYMLVLVPVLALAGGLAADALFPRTLPGWVRAAALAMAAVALLGAALRDDGLMFGERALASFVAQTSAPVVTDPGTYTGAWWLLHVEGREGQVRPGWPVHGGIWFANAQPRRTGLGGLITPGADWPVLARYVQPPRAMTRWLRASGVLGVLPPALALRLAPVRREAVAYLVP